MDKHEKLNDLLSDEKEKVKALTTVTENIRSVLNGTQLSSVDIERLLIINRLLQIALLIVTTLLILIVLYFNTKKINKTVKNCVNDKGHNIFQM